MAKAQALILIIILVVVVAGGFLFFNQSSKPAVQDQEQIPPINIEEPTPSEPEQPSQQTKEISVTAKQWEFNPNPIKVNEGDLVILNIRSIDVSHGISIPDFGISERLSPGKETKIEFIADKKGTFTFFCNVQCGSGHSSMKGQFIVE